MNGGEQITDHLLCFKETALGGGHLHLQGLRVSQKQFERSIEVQQVDVLEHITQQDMDFFSSNFSNNSGGP